MKLSQIAKSPLTYIAVAVAITAFAAGLFVSAQTPADIAASGPGEVKDVVVLRTVTYQNPDGTWPSPVPTIVPPSAQSDYDLIRPGVLTGIDTMGKVVRLYSGVSIQLPPDVYVDDHILNGSCFDHQPNCPEFPVAVLARGNYWVLIDRYGKPVLGWTSRPEYKPDAFEFLNE